MRGLLAKILLSMVISVTVALIIVFLITRVSLQAGLVTYIENQEAVQLQRLAPELAELYRQEGGWEFLRGRPLRWNRQLRLTRPHPGTVDGAFDPPPPGPPGRNKSRPPFPERLQFLRRLFLLDDQKSHVVGAITSEKGRYRLEAVEVAGELVGWIGFVPLRAELPWTAQSFLRNQARMLLISLFIALVLAGFIGFLLARHIARPVRELAGEVTALTRGEYGVRADIRTRDEIGALGRDVNRLAETLEKNRTARRRWMADIAHELRTPAAILKGEIEALEDGVRPVNKQTIASLREETQHLARLIDDLQTLALADAGALNLQMEAVNFSALTQQSGEAFRTRLAARGIELQLRIGERIILSADPQRLKQLLHNLLENCCRYVEENGQVRLSLAAKDHTVVLSLDDSGPGLRTEQMKQLFERFYRVEGSRSRATGGSGLGLAICRNIVEAHQGSIRAENSSMGGLCIHVELRG
jgi:two-component system sensor histidine kinase BaeS